MIRSRNELKFYLKADEIMNEQVFPNKWWKKILFPSIIHTFLRVYRYADYYKYLSSINKIYKIPYLIYKMRLNNLKVKTGFDIPIGAIGYGVRIGHISSIIINDATKIGNYCCLNNNIVIGDGLPKKIGDHCYIASNVVIAKEIEIADGCSISACSFMNRNALIPNMLWGGVNAKPIMKKSRWTDTGVYRIEYEKCENLKKAMKI